MKNLDSISSQILLRELHKKSPPTELTIINNVKFDGEMIRFDLPIEIQNHRYKKN